MFEEMFRLCELFGCRDPSLGCWRIDDMAIVTEKQEMDLARILQLTHPWQCYLDGFDNLEMALASHILLPPHLHVHCETPWILVGI